MQDVFKRWVGLSAGARAGAGAALMLVAGLAQANGLADVRQALGRLAGQAPVRAQVECHAWRAGDDGKETSGSVQLTAEDSARGLSLHLGKELLQRIDAERRAKDGAEGGKPLSAALDECSALQLRKALSAAQELARLLEDMTLKAESAEPYKGQPARKLVLERSIDTLHEKERKYVKQYEDKAELWITAEGVPLALSQRVALSGRFMVVVSFEQKMEQDIAYAVNGDRLVALRQDQRQSGSGGGEKGRSRVTRSVGPAS